MESVLCSTKRPGARPVGAGRDASRRLAAAALALSMAVLAGCTPSKDDEFCMIPANIEWDWLGTTPTTYLSNDTTLGSGSYPEGPTENSGSACYLTLLPTNCQAYETYITNTFAVYEGDTHIDGGSGNFRIASISFDGDVGLVSQFNAAGSGTEGSTAHFNGDRVVPQYLTIVSSYPLSTAPADAAEGEQECLGHDRATIRLE